MSFPGSASGKEPTCQRRRCNRHRFDHWARKTPGGGHGDPRQHSCQDNPADRGAWQAEARRVTKSWTWLKPLSTQACTHTCGILAPPSGTELAPLHWKVESNHWTTREVPLQETSRWKPKQSSWGATGNSFDRESQGVSVCLCT